MWVLNRARDNSDRITALQTYSFEAGFFFFFFFFFLHCNVWGLRNQLLLHFSMEVSQTLQIHYGYIENVHVDF